MQQRDGLAFFEVWLKKTLSSATFALLLCASVPLWPLYLIFEQLLNCHRHPISAATRDG